eukprot:13727189-Ditylum_brightwellii.AAC.1
MSISLSLPTTVLSEGGSYSPPDPFRSQDGDKKQQRDVNVISPERAPLRSSVLEGSLDRYSSLPH